MRDHSVGYLCAIDIVAGSLLMMQDAYAGRTKQASRSLRRKQAEEKVAARDEKIKMFHLSDKQTSILKSFLSYAYAAPLSEDARYHLEKVETLLFLKNPSSQQIQITVLGVERFLLNNQRSPR